MNNSKTLKILSYILLPILIGIIIISVFYISTKDSIYYNEEKYFESDNFINSYINSLSFATQRLIYNNPNYKCIKDGDIQIFYGSEEEINLYGTELIFLIIYNNKALTNVELTSEVNSIENIINYIENNQDYKKLNIINGKVESDTEIINKKAEQYLDEFINTYYTKNTDSSIEYQTTNINDFKIYSSYPKTFEKNSEQTITTKLIKELEPYEKDLCILIPICTIFSILIVVYLINAIEGKLNDFDKIPLEIVLLGLLIIGGIPLIIVSNSYTEGIEFKISIGVTAYITIYLMIAITFDTIVKRIKSKQFWKTTLIGKISIFIKNKIDKLKNIPTDFKGTIIKSGLICFGALVLGIFVANIFNRTFAIFINIIIIFILFFRFIEIIKNYNKLEGELFEESLQERLKSERLKTELITNVSHDIKTPLTSIINYVDLLKKEEISNEKAIEYIDILDNKSKRLKKLIEDLVEASKVSTGNIKLNLEKINIVELIKQAEGEFEDKFQAKSLTTIITSEENEIYIMADSRYMSRVIENLFSNISKYALENSRVYIDIIKKNNKVYIEIKNISKEKLNISADELRQRFVRGDKSRTTEGSGLGLSITQDLTTLQNGKFNLILDGDLFKVELIFDIIEEGQNEE